MREIKQIDPENIPEIQELVNETTGEKIQDNALAGKINNFFIERGEKLASKFNSSQENNNSRLRY